MSPSNTVLLSSVLALSAALSGCGLVTLSTSVNGKQTTYGGSGSGAAAGSQQAALAPAPAAAPAPAPAAPPPAAEPPPAEASAPAAAPAPGRAPVTPAAPTYTAAAMPQPERQDPAPSAPPSRAPAAHDTSEPQLVADSDDPMRAAAKYMQGTLGGGADANLAPAVGPLDRLLQRDRAQAEGARQDLGVFGIKLTYPLSLPSCPRSQPTLLNPLGDAMLGVNVSTPCIGGGGSLMDLQSHDMAKKRLHGGGIQERKVSFPKSTCPDWLTNNLSTSCSVDVISRHGHVSSISFRTRGKNSERTITEALTKKYGAPAPDNQSEDTWCEVMGREVLRLKVKSFSPPGLTVTYNPVGAECPSVNSDGAGLVTIQTNAHGDWVRAAKKQRESQRMSL